MSLDSISELSSILGNMSSEQDNIKDNLSADETEGLAILGSSETVTAHVNGFRVQTRVISSDYIYDFSIYDAAYYEGSYDNLPSLVQVTNDGNRFVEYFYNTRMQDMTNSNVFTTSGALTMSSSSAQVWVSQPIAYRDGSIIDFTINAQSDTPLIVLSYSTDGTTWSNVSNGTTVSFATAVTQLLWKVTNAITGTDFPTPFGSWGDLNSSAVIDDVRITYTKA